MEIVVNGETRQVRSPISLAELLQTLELPSDRVAVELNRQIVHRDRWAETALCSQDRLEIVHFVGGG
jgi:thiamine biosynthesis protein ThiS